MIGLLLGLILALALLTCLGWVALSRLTASLRELRIEADRWARPHPRRAGRDDAPAE